jgi:hypothetical protein
MTLEWELFLSTIRAGDLGYEGDLGHAGDLGHEGDLGHFDKFFSLNLFSYLAVKCVMYWLGIIF